MHSKTTISRAFFTSAKIKTPKKGEGRNLCEATEKNRSYANNIPPFKAFNFFIFTKFPTKQHNTTGYEQR